MSDLVVVKFKDGTYGVRQPDIHADNPEFLSTRGKFQFFDGSCRVNWCSFKTYSAAVARLEEYTINKATVDDIGEEV